MKKEDVESFLNQMVQLHVRTTTIKNDDDGEAMMSNIYQGFIVRLSDSAVFMGNVYEDSDKFDVTAVVDLTDIAAITLAEDEIPDFLLEMPSEEDEVH